jgi:spoIIIJ-associated protein
MDKKQILERTVEHIKFILDSFVLSAEVSVEFVPSDNGETDKYIMVKLNGDNLNELVGFHGKNMDSVQNIVSIMLSKEFNQDLRILLEVNDYREKREKYLQSIAQRAALEVQSSGQDVELPPMKPSERRVVHMVLKEENGIISESIGEGEDRRIVIKKAN